MCVCCSTYSVHYTSRETQRLPRDQISDKNSVDRRSLSLSPFRMQGEKSRKKREKRDIWQGPSSSSSSQTRSGALGLRESMHVTQLSSAGRDDTKQWKGGWEREEGGVVVSFLSKGAADQKYVREGGSGEREKRGAVQPKGFPSLSFSLSLLAISPTYYDSSLASLSAIIAGSLPFSPHSFLLFFFPLFFEERPYLWKRRRTMRELNPICLLSLSALETTAAICRIAALREKC